MLEKQKKGKKRLHEVIPREDNPVIFDNATVIWQPNGLPFNAQLVLKNISQAKIIVKIIERLQQPIKLSISYRNNPYQLSLFNDMMIDENFIQLDFELSEFKINKSNYNRLKRDFVAIQRNYSVIHDTVYYNTKIKENIEASEIKPLISSVIIPLRYERYISIKIEKCIAELLVKVGEAGYTRYLLEIAMRSKSKYTLLIYQLICSWKSKGGFTWTIQRFKEYLGITDKYQNWKDLNQRVIKPAYRELNGKSDFWFEYDIDMKSRTAYKINFKIIAGHWKLNTDTPIYLDEEIIYTVDYRTLSQQAKQCIDFLNKRLLISDINIVCEIISKRFNDYENWYRINSKKIERLDNPAASLLYYLKMTRKQGWKPQKWQLINNNEVNPVIQSEYKIIWENVCKILSDTINQKDIETWFKPLSILDIYIEPKGQKTKIVIISTPSQFCYEKIENSFINEFKKALQSVFIDMPIIQYRVKPNN